MIDKTIKCEDLKSPGYTKVFYCSLFGNSMLGMNPHCWYVLNDNEDLIRIFSPDDLLNYE